jgi:PHD/YefM family antitoxin component YafN of YafNO toxin-antitoxin module
MIKQQSAPCLQTRIDRLRHRFLSIPHASQQLQTLARQIIKEQRRALILVDGKKAAVLITYEEYQQIERLRTQQMKLDALQQLNELITRRSGQVT